jgi:hypothetical protein
MKLKNLAVILYTIIGCCFLSCSKDDDGGYSKLANQEHVIEYKLISNTSGTQMTISNYNGIPLIINDHWEAKLVTKDYYAQFVARCDNDTTLMTGEIYVDGKLKLRREANSYLDLTVKIK